MGKKVAFILLYFMVFTVNCYASEIQQPTNATVSKNSDDVYFPKFLSFGVGSNLFCLEEESFEVGHCPYMLEDGMIMLPLRDLFDVIQKAEESYELVQYRLIWHENTKQIECRAAQWWTKILIDENKFSVNGEEARELEYPLVNRDGTIYISLKDIAPILCNSYDLNFYDIINNRFGVWI